MPSHKAPPLPVLCTLTRCGQFQVGRALAPSAAAGGGRETPSCALAAAVAARCNRSPAWSPPQRRWRICRSRRACRARACHPTRAEARLLALLCGRQLAAERKRCARLTEELARLKGKEKAEQARYKRWALHCSR